MNWFESLLLGLVSGFAEVLPISANAHRQILIKLFGAGSEPAAMSLVVHIATLGALYLCCSSHLIRIQRELRIARVPKRRRKRPADIKTILDFRLLRTGGIVMLIVFVLCTQLSFAYDNLLSTAVCLILNGVILSLPMFISTANKDSRNLSRVDSMLMGLGSGLGILPGFSSTGMAAAVGISRGADPSFALEMSLLLAMPVNAAMIVYDIYRMITTPSAAITFAAIASYLVIGLACAIGVYIGVRLIRHIARNTGFTGFAYYSWGAALFAFIFYLTT